MGTRDADYMSTSKTSVSAVRFKRAAATQSPTIDTVEAPRPVNVDLRYGRNSGVMTGAESFVMSEFGGERKAVDSGSE